MCVCGWVCLSIWVRVCECVRVCVCVCGCTIFLYRRPGIVSTWGFVRFSFTDVLGFVLCFPTTSEERTGRRAGSMPGRSSVHAFAKTRSSGINPLQLLGCVCCFCAFVSMSCENGFFCRFCPRSSGLLIFSPAQTGVKELNKKSFSISC